MNTAFIIYVIEGLFIFFINILFFVAIVRTVRLREKYGLMGFEFLADGLAGLAVMMAGLIRLIKMHIKTDHIMMSQRLCMLMPFNLILYWAEPMTAFSMLTVSIDRMFSILKPVRYYKNTVRIQWYLISFSHLVAVPLTLTSSMCSFINNQQIHGFCWTPRTRCAAFNSVMYAIRTAAAAISVILYVIVLIIVRRFTSKRMQTQTPTAVYDKRQLHLTVTAGFSCIATVGLYVLPMVIALYDTGREASKVASTLFTVVIIVSNLNSVPKVLIIGWRSVDLREAALGWIFKYIMPGLVTVVNSLSSIFLILQKMNKPFEV